MSPDNPAKPITSRWDAADYEQHSSAQQSWAAELIAKLGLAGHERLLDLGCGDGKITAQLAQLLPQGEAVGVDNSEAMISFSRESFPAADWSNLSFVLANVCDLPFSEEFDVVFSNATLHWVHDHPAVLRCISRALRPGGKVLLQMGGPGNAAGLFAVAEQMLSEDSWEPFFPGFVFPWYFHGPEQYRDWLREAGLEPIRVELLAKDMCQGGAEWLVGWSRTTWMPYTERLPEDLRAPFLEELVARYAIEHPPDEQGRLHVAMRRLEVEARKI